MAAAHPKIPTCTTLQNAGEQADPCAKARMATDGDAATTSEGSSVPLLYEAAMVRILVCALGYI